MKNVASRCRFGGSKVLQPVNGWKFLVWVMLSSIMIMLAQGFSGYSIFLNIAGWFAVIPVEPIFLGALLVVSLLYLLHRWAVAAFPPTLYVLTIRNTQVANPWVAYSFSPFSKSTISELEEALFEQDCQLWGKEALWEYGEGERIIAYLDYTAEFKVPPATFYRACWHQWIARQ